MSEDLDRLISDIEQCRTKRKADIEALSSRIRAALPDSAEFDIGSMSSCEDALETVASLLPEWAVSIKGAATPGKGNWTCTLRQNSWDDEVEAIGIGRSHSVSLAVVAALVMAVTRLEAEKLA